MQCDLMWAFPQIADGSPRLLPNATERSAVPPNKGMKQTSVEHIGRSQLIPGVVRTVPGEDVRQCARI